MGSPFKILARSMNIELRPVPDSFVKRIMGVTMHIVLTSWANIVPEIVEASGSVAVGVS